MKNRSYSRAALLCAAACLGWQNAQANLVVNGSFESGSGANIAGWVVNSTGPGGHVPGIYTFGAYQGANVTDGSQALDFGLFGYGHDIRIQQSIATVVGQRYVLSFDWGSEYGWGAVGEVKVSGLGTVLQSPLSEAPRVLEPAMTSTPWLTYHESFTFVADGTSMLLEFSTYSSGNAGIDYGGLVLDNVRFEISNLSVAQEWTAQYDNYVGGAGDEGLKVVRDLNGDVIVTGQSRSDILTVKYSGATGAKLWEVRYNGPANSADYPAALMVDSGGNVIVAGYSPGIGSSYDYYTARYAATDGALLWSQRYNGPANSDDFARAVAVDASGNVIVAGHSREVGTGIDCYTAKYAATDGALLWSQRYNGPANSDDFALAVAVDATGNVIVTGHSIGNGSNFDYYTAKYAATDGVILWSQRYNGPANSDDFARAVAVDANGNVIVAGYSVGNGSSTDYYTAKYAATDGALLWSQRYNGPANSSDNPSAVVADANGNVIVAGYSVGNGSSADYYTAKYAATDGALLWSQRYSGAANSVDFAQDVAVDASGNVIVTGYSWSGSSYDYYTAKYAAIDGAVLWEQRYNGTGYSVDVAQAVVVDESGNAIVTGYSHNGSTVDYYTAKYNADDGTLLWSQRYDGPVNRQDSVVAAALDPSGNVAVTGISYNGSNNDFYTAKYAAGSGALLWERRYNGPANTLDEPRGIVTDGSGSVIVTGFSNQDYHTLKYAPDGTLLWERRFNGSVNGADEPHAVTIDAAGNVIVTGSSFNGSDNDFYTAKYAAADGAVIWERYYDGPAGELDVAYDVTVDGSGNVIVAGVSENGFNADIYTAKYAAADGALIWEHQHDGSGHGLDGTKSVTVDAAGNVIITGTTYNGANLDFYTAKYAAADGALIWDKSYSGPVNFTNQGEDVVVDANGDVIATGYSNNGSDYDYYTVKYAGANGDVVWEKRYHGVLTDEARSVALDADGNVVVTGRSTGAGGNMDYYTAKYAAANGALLWEKRYAGPGNVSDEAVTVLVDRSTDRTIVAGTSDQNFLTLAYFETPPPVIDCPADIAVQVTDLAGTVVNFTATATDDSGLPPTIVCVPASGSVFLPGETIVTCTATDNHGAASSCSFLVTVSAQREFQVGAMPFVVVDHANNAADPLTGFGAVAYPFSIGKYEVTLNEYAAFLNAVAAADPAGLYAPELATTPTTAGILRSGISGSFIYSVIGDGQRPATFVSWFDAARYANWMHNGRPTGAQDSGTTEDGAYTLNGATSGMGFTRNSAARFWIPSEDEWYKAAYYQPFSEGGDTDGYWLFPTRSNVKPNSRNGSLTDPNSANLFRDDGLIDGVNDGFAVSGNPIFSPSQGYLTPVGAFAKARSPFYTFDQGGNVWEWNTAVVGSSERGLRGGAWGDIQAETQLQSTYRISIAPDYRSEGTGFRLATLGTLHLQPPQNMLVLGCNPGGVTPVNYSLTVIGLAPVVSCTPPSGSDFSPGVTTVNCSGTDAFGNTASCSFTVTVESCPTPPVVTCPADMVVISTSYPNVCGEVVNFSGSVTDDCSSPVLTCVPPSGSVFPLGVTTVTCTAVNRCGNSASDSFTVTVLEPASGDYFEPCWRGLAGSTFQHWMFTRSDTTISPELVSNGGSPEATVVLGDFAYGWVNAEEGLGCRQGYWDLGAAGTVTLNVPEAAAPAGAYRYVRLQTLTFRDQLAYPADITRSVSGATKISESETIREQALIGDWVVNVSLWRLPNTPAVTTVTLTAPPTSALLDQVVVETFAMTPPTCPSDIVANADPGLCVKSAVPLGLPEIDGCTVSAIACQVNGVPISLLADFPLGTTVVQCSISDPEGEARNCSFSVTILDATAPAIVSCAPAQSASADLSCLAAVPDFAGNLVATDCNGPLVVTQSPAPGTVVGLGAHTITLTVRDAANNPSVCTTTFTVNDTTAPSIVSCAPAQSASADLSCQAAVPDFTGNVVATDCNGPLVVTQSPAPGTIVGLGAHIITLTVHDAANNADVCTTTFTVNDTTAPAIVSCPPAQSASADLSCQTAVPDFTGNVVATDCNGPLVVTQSPAPGTVVGLGAHTITLTVWDAANNPSVCTTTFTVNDTTPPAIVSCAPAQSASADLSCQTPVPDFTGNVVATDCNGPVIVTQSPAPGTVVGLGAHTITLTVSDAANNPSVCTTTFTVNDTTAPAIVSCAPAQSASADLSCQTAVPDFTGNVVATDCNGPLVVTQSPAPGTVVGLGAHTITLTVSDAANNPSVCTTTFTVNDTTPPVVVACAPAQSANADSGTCTAPLPDFTTAVVATDCNGPVVITQSPPPNTAMPLGTHSITITVRDQANNTVPCTTTFTVLDGTAPVVTVCPPSRTIDLSTTCDTTLPDLLPELVAEDCNGVNTLLQSPGPGTSVGVGTHLVTFTIRDLAGNESTCSTTVTVRDVAPPVIGSFTATETSGATQYDLLNCARHVFPGTVRFTVAVSDQCPVAAPTITLVNGAHTDTAVLVEQSPAGPATALVCTYEWMVTTATPEGSWTATVTVSDSATTTTANYQLCVTRPRITGEMQLQGFIGSVTPTRTVTFVATSSAGTVLKTWSIPVLFSGPQVKGTFTLLDVPLDTAAVSAKTAWHKRRKFPSTLAFDNTAVLNFTGSTRELLGGDLNGDNIVNFGDYLRLATRYLETVDGPSDPDDVANINGDGVVNFFDYLIFGQNWFSAGDPQ